MTDLEVLGLPPGATAGEVRARWQRLAPRLHPDRGGDPGAFRAALEAYRRAVAAAGEPEPCDSCGGTGRVLARGALHAVRLACDACGGTGSTRPEDRGPAGGGATGGGAAG